MIFKFLNAILMQHKFSWKTFSNFLNPNKIVFSSNKIKDEEFKYFSWADLVQIKFIFLATANFISAEDLQH